MPQRRGKRASDKESDQGFNQVRSFIRALPADNKKFILKKINDEYSLLEKKQGNTFLKNCLRYICSSIKGKKKAVIIIKILNHRAANLSEKLKRDRKFIVELASHKIPKGGCVYVHGNSRMILDILCSAIKKKNFNVVNTENRPLLCGRIFASLLSKSGIQVHHYADISLINSLDRADIIMIEADSILPTGNVVASSGVGIVARIAFELKIPFYACIHTFKFGSSHKALKDNPENEVWERPPKNVTVHNPSQEEIPGSMITGIISELGIFRPETINQKIKENYQWIK